VVDETAIIVDVAVVVLLVGDDAVIVNSVTEDIVVVVLVVVTEDVVVIVVDVFVCVDFVVVSGLLLNMTLLPWLPSCALGKKSFCCHVSDPGLRWEVEMRRQRGRFGACVACH